MNRKLFLHGKVNQAERDLLEKIARSERVTLSEALRIALRSEGRRRGLWPPPDPPGDECQEVPA